MIVIFLNNGVVTGYHPNLSQEEIEAYPGDFVEVETLPDEIVNFSGMEGYVVKYVDGTFRVEQLPPEPPSPEERIAQLEAESAMLALELVETQIRLEQSENEQAALILELVEKGVI